MRYKAIIAALVAASAAPGGLFGQDTSAPMIGYRGLMPGQTYDVSGVEHIGIESETLNLNIPVASLPPAPGNSSWPGVSLNYNSDIFDFATPQERGRSQSGGDWSYNYQYRVLVSDEQIGSLDAGGFTRSHVNVLFPDGGLHSVGYYDLYVGTPPTSLASHDGTFARLEPQYDSIHNIASWTLYLKDGTRVYGYGADWTTYRPIDNIGNYSYTSSIVDRNGNSLIYVFGTDTTSGSPTYNDPIVTITDQAGRQLKITFSDQSAGAHTQDLITFPGANGGMLTTAVNWTSWTVPYVMTSACNNTSTFTYECWIGQDNFGVDSIELPDLGNGSEAPSQLFYYFGYDSQDNGIGWGQLSRMQLPTGPIVSYQYQNTIDTSLASTIAGTSLQGVPLPPMPPLVVRNPIKQKSVTYPDAGWPVENTTYTPWGAPSGADWTYNASINVTNPDGGVRTYTGVLQPYSPTNPPKLVKTKDPNGDITDQVWMGCPGPSDAYTLPNYLGYLPAAEFHTVAGSPARTSAKLYSYDLNGNPLTESEYDFTSSALTFSPDSLGQPIIPATSSLGAPIRTKTRTWTATTASNPVLVQSGSPFPYTSCPGLTSDGNSYAVALASSTHAATKLDVPATAAVSDYGGTEAKTTFTYIGTDAYTTGNPSAKKDWDSELGSNPDTNTISTGYTYDGGGNVASITDPNGTLTSNTYTYLSGTWVVQDLEKTVNWQSRPFTSLYHWDWHSGLLTSSTDPAGTTTSYQYDNAGRVTWITEGSAVQRLTNAHYAIPNTVRGSPAVNPVSIRITKTDNQGGPTLVETQVFDTRGNMVSDTKGDTVVTKLSPWISGTCAAVDTTCTHDAVSNAQLTSGNDSQAGWTVTRKDNMGRVVETDYYAGAGKPSPWGAGATLLGSTHSYYAGGYVTSVVDESGKRRDLTVDGAGRLRNVAEDPTGLNYQTAYTYDFGDRLRTVNQSGLVRNFQYSTLGRLVEADNPETGNGTNGNAILYMHDSNGNVIRKLDARGIGTNYGYDSLNRLRTKVYPDGATPQATWCYDGDANSESSTQRGIGVIWNCSGAPTSTGATLNTRLTMTSAGGNLTRYTGYDELGEVLGTQQVTNGQTYTFNVGGWYPSVNLMNAETNVTTGRRLNWTPDPANGLRVNCISGTSGGTTTYYAYVSQFFGSGAPANLVEGANTCSEGATGLRTATATYDARLRPGTLSYLNGGSVVESLSYAWDPNGNLNTEWITNNVNGALALTQTFNGAPYDGVNRLIQASESGGLGWMQQFGYDPYGNRTLFTSSTLPHAAVTPTASLGGFALGQNFTGGPYNSRNQTTGVAYDSGGDQTGSAGMVTTATASYDAENRIVTETDSSVTSPVQFPVSYSYDADGRRVLKAWCTSGTTCTAATAGAKVTTYVYDAAGELAMESGPAPAAAGPEYLFTDHLGSTRIMVEAGSGATHCYDYAPFGEELGPGVNGRGACYEALNYPSPTPGSVSDKFTGKERDAETGLDYFGARYFNSAQGKFTSPDPANLSVDFGYPQSWNRYAYSLDNPLSVVDRNGLWPTWVHNQIINEAFPGLTGDQLKNLQTASKNVDSDQSMAGAAKHGMANGQDPNGSVHAETDSDEFISRNLHNARSIQSAWIASGNTGVAPGALTAFGNALHTVTDKTSPSHQNFQPWYGTGLFDLPEAAYHFVREAWPWGGNHERQQDAVNAARQYFLQTFGDDAAVQAETPKKPKVTSTICFQADSGQVCP